MASVALFTTIKLARPTIVRMRYIVMKTVGGAATQQPTETRKHQLNMTILNWLALVAHVRNALVCLTRPNQVTGQMTSAMTYVTTGTVAMKDVHGSVAAVPATPLAFQKEEDGKINDATDFVTKDGGPLGTSKFAMEDAISIVKGVLAISLKNDCAILPN